MDLKFRTLVIRHFKSIRYLKFQFDRGAGANLIVGRNKYRPRLGANGVGKSSLGDALCFCYYGKTITGLRGPDIRPWVKTSKPTTLEHWFIRGDTKHHLVRQVAPNRLFLDGKEVNQDRIDEVVGMNYETFTNTIVLGQGQPLFFDLTPSKKMEILTEALYLDRWEERSSRASKEASRLELVADSYASQAISKEDQYKETKRRYLDTKERADKWTSEHAANRSANETELKRLMKERDAAQRNYEDANLAYDSALTELRPLEKQIRSLTSTVEQAKAEKAVAERQLVKSEARLVELTDELKKVKAGKCPTCNGPFSNRPHRERLERKIEETREEIKQLSEQASGKSFTKEKKLAARLAAAAEQFIEKADKAKDKMDFFHPTYTEAKLKVVNMQKTLEEQDNPYTSMVRDLKKQKVKDWDDLQKLLFQQTLAERKAKRVRFWVKGFKDLQLHLIKEILQELEIATNTMLDQMGLVGWTIQYATEKENKKGNVKRGLSLFVQSPDNSAPVRWECWSGGEAQRLRIAGSLALSEVLLAKAGVDTSLEILDEPSKSLSVEGVKDLCEFLDFRASQLQKTIYYVDHTVRESSLFRSTIVVTRTADGSTAVSA